MQTKQEKNAGVHQIDLENVFTRICIPQTTDMRLSLHHPRSEIFRLHRHLYPMEVARRGGEGIYLQISTEQHLASSSNRRSTSGGLDCYLRRGLDCLEGEVNRHRDPANRCATGALHGTEASDAAGYVCRAVHRSNKVCAGFLGDD